MITECHACKPHPGDMGTMCGVACRCVCHNSKSGCFNGYYRDERMSKRVYEWLMALESENETLRMQLAGCSVVALCNTRETFEKQGIDRNNAYWTPAYEDIRKAVYREMNYRECLERISQMAPDEREMEAHKIAEDGLSRRYE